MTPQAVLVCLVLGMVVGWVACRFASTPPAERIHHLPSHGEPPSNIRLLRPPTLYDQDTA